MVQILTKSTLSVSEFFGLFPREKWKVQVNEILINNFIRYFLNIFANSR